MRTVTVLVRVAAALGTVLLALLPLAPARAAEPRDPTTLLLPTGQGIELRTDPLTLIGHTGAQGTPAGQVPDFDVDLILLRCGYSVGHDGTVRCGLVGRPTPAPVPSPAPSPPVPAPVPGGPTPDQAPGHQLGAPAGAADAQDSVPPRASTESRSGRGQAADGVAEPVEEVVPDAEFGGSDPGGSGPVDSGPRAASALSTDEVLGLGATAFALLALVGRRGLAAASGASRRRFPRASDDAEGEVTFAESEMYEFDPEVAGQGDISRSWRLISGWVLVDRLSRVLPKDLATRAPLLARIAADGTYLRAVLGAGWLVLPAGGVVLGLLAAHDSAGYPLAPALPLTGTLLAIAVLDAAAGLAGVLGFAVGLFVWGPGDLGIAPSLRGFLGLAALWFAIPLIASTARPLRRTRERTALYAWDRLADGVVAALVSGWAVQGVVDGLPGLSGHVSPIDEHPDLLALVAIGAVAARVGVEEVATRMFPERLKIVDTGLLPDPTALRQIASAVLRTGVFVFVAWSFVGNCWQLWAAALIFLLPALLDVAADRFPSSERLFQLIPRGVALVLVMLVAEGVVAYQVEGAFEGKEAIRTGFVLLALPGLVLAVLSLFGRDGPTPARSWRNELLGALTVALCVTLVLQGY